MPSASSSHAPALSASSVSKTEERRVRRRSFSTGTTSSSRLSRFLDIRSALPISQRRVPVAAIEVVDAAVLEEATEHRANVDVLGKALHARAKRADRAHDRLDARTGARRVVELVDDRGVGQRVDLDANPRLLSVGRRLRDAANLVDETLPQVVRRDEDLAKRRRLAEAREVVEQVGDVGGDLLVGGEEAEVLVDPSVVARGSYPCRRGRSGGARRLRSARPGSP